jgi:hypothetical protein
MTFVRLDSARAGMTFVRLDFARAGMTFVRLDSGARRNDRSITATPIGLALD